MYLVKKKQLNQKNRWFIFFKTMVFDFFEKKTMAFANPGRNIYPLILDQEYTIFLFFPNRNKK